jgi:hypothetical protein
MSYPSFFYARCVSLSSRNQSTMSIFNTIHCMPILFIGFRWLCTCVVCCQKNCTTRYIFLHFLCLCTSHSFLGAKQEVVFMFTSFIFHTVFYLFQGRVTQYCSSMLLFRSYLLFQISQHYIFHGYQIWLTYQ